MIKDDDIYMPVLLAAYYGLRRSEAVGLSWSNIDFENGIIHVSQKVIELTENGKTELIISKDMKNETSRRSLPLISDVKKILLEQKERQETYRKMFRGTITASISTWSALIRWAISFIPRAFSGTA